MAASTETVLYIYPRAEVAVDSGDGLTFNLHGKDVQTLVEDATNGVTPVVYSNGVVVNSANYTVNKGDQSTDASITFTGSQSGNIITVDYKWKYVNDTEEDFTAYEISKQPNSRLAEDVNGGNLIVSSYSRTTDFRVMLGWSFINQAFWDEIRILSEGDYYTFDIERTSLTSPLDRINNLYVTNYPQFVDIVGVPGRYNVTIEAAQVQ